MKYMPLWILKVKKHLFLQFNRSIFHISMSYQRKMEEEAAAVEAEQRRKLRQPGEKFTDWVSRQSPSQKHMHILLGTTKFGELTTWTNEEYLQELLEHNPEYDLYLDFEDGFDPEAENCPPSLKELYKRHQKAKQDAAAAEAKQLENAAAETKQLKDDDDAEDVVMSNVS